SESAAATSTSAIEGPARRAGRHRVAGILHTLASRADTGAGPWTNRGRVCGWANRAPGVGLSACSARMRLQTGWSEFESGGARLRGYVTRPATRTDPLPVAIVIQEAWGVDEHIRDVADRLAYAGYLAFAPDLY